ncbi:MAG: cytochrome c biogenesis CcdA family protein [Candidatus Geothermarchaeales archaeon]
MSNVHSVEGQGRKSYLWLVGIALAIAAIVAAGYLAFVAFVQGSVPSAGAVGLMLFSVVAGVAAFFNPCAFPVLPSYLKYHATAGAGTNAGGGRVLSSGGYAALGVISFNLILGLLIGVLGSAFGSSFALTGDEPNLWVRLFRGGVGSALVILGLSHFTGRGVSFGFLAGLGHRFTATSGANPVRGLFTYGFGYNAIGIGCGGPILAGLAVLAFSFGGFASAIVAFLVYSLTMGVLMIIVSLLAGLAKEKVIKRLSSSTGSIQRASGLIQTLVGVFLLFSAVYTGLFVSVLFPGS